MIVVPQVTFQCNTNTIPGQDNHEGKHDTEEHHKHVTVLWDLREEVVVPDRPQ